MKTNEEQLMKHFASVLRGRALGNLVAPSIDKKISQFFTRKELIEIIKKRFDGTIPKEHNLVELENEELVALIEDEMYIISYVTEAWSKALSEKKASPVKPIAISDKAKKQVSNDKKDAPSKK